MCSGAKTSVTINPLPRPRVSFEAADGGHQVVRLNEIIIQEVISGLGAIPEHDSRSPLSKHSTTLGRNYETVIHMKT